MFVRVTQFINKRAEFLFFQTREFIDSPKGFRVDRRGKKSNKRYTVQNGRIDWHLHSNLSNASTRIKLHCPSGSEFCLLLIEFHFSCLKLTDGFLSFFVFFLFYRGADQIAVSGLHNLRPEDLFGQCQRIVRRSSVGLRDGPVVRNVGLCPREENGGHPPSLHGTLPQRKDVPVPVKIQLSHYFHSFHYIRFS